MKYKLTFNAADGVVIGVRGAPVGSIHPTGYVRVRVDKAGNRRLAHRLIWESVHGPIPKGMEINHIDGIKTNNKIGNLELVTSSQNAIHAYKLGLRRADGIHNGRHTHGKSIGAAAASKSRRGLK